MGKSLKCLQLWIEGLLLSASMHAANDDCAYDNAGLNDDFQTGRDRPGGSCRSTRKIKAQTDSFVVTNVVGLSSGSLPGCNGNGAVLIRWWQQSCETPSAVII